MKTSLSADMNDPEAIPYFLWDAPMTVAQFKERLASASIPERMRRTGKLLREARDTDVWRFLTPFEVCRQWDAIAPQHGRRRALWQILFHRWHEVGSLGAR